MAKQKPESRPLGFAAELPAVEPVAVAAQVEPVKPAEPAKPIEYDLNDVAVLHDLRKKGLLWRVKGDACACFLCVCETEQQAICLFKGKYPDSVGKVKATQLRP